MTYAARQDLIDRAQLVDRLLRIDVPDHPLDGAGQGPGIALGAGQEYATPRMKLSAAPPYPSQHEITVTLDTENKVAESDETNNTCRLTVKLVES